MESGAAPRRREDEGLELWEVASPAGTRCAFCLQRLESPEAAACPRCRAAYHADCWSANDRRCAIYGCEPAALPPAPARPRRRVARVEPATRPGGRWSWGWVTFAVIGIGQLLARVGTHRATSGETAPPPRIEIPAFEADGGAPALSFPSLSDLQSAEARAVEAEVFLAALEERDDLPDDLESSVDLSRRVDEAIGTLRRARDFILKFPWSSRVDSGFYRIRQLNDSLRRLQRLSDLLVVR